MSLEENKAVVCKMFEAINKHSLASLDKLMAPDFVLHMHAQQTQGWKVNRQVIEEEMKSFPDLQRTIRLPFLIVKRNRSLKNLSDLVMLKSLSHPTPL